MTRYYQVPVTFHQNVAFIDNASKRKIKYSLVSNSIKDESKEKLA